MNERFTSLVTSCKKKYVLKKCIKQSILINFLSFLLHFPYDCLKYFYIPILHVITIISSIVIIVITTDIVEVHFRSNEFPMAKAKGIVRSGVSEIGN